MRAIVRFFLAVAIAAACVSTGPGAFAQKKPTGTPPPGVIYFKHDNTIWRMNADGSSRAPVPGSPEVIDGFAHPSFQRHGGAHWFTHRETPLPVYFPNLHQYVEIWAVSAETGDRVPLVADADLNVLSHGVWLPDDQSVCFIAQRWSLDEGGQPVEVVEAGLYEVAVAFEGTGTLIGAVPDSVHLLAELSPEMRIDQGAFSSNGDNFVNGLTWSPDLSTCAFALGFRFNQQTSQEIWMLDVTQIDDPLAVPPSALKLFLSGNGVGHPNWSPDGRRLSYVNATGSVVHDLERNRTKVLQRGATFGWGSAKWSPDGAHCVLYHYDNFVGYDGIYRFTADLSGKTKISGTLCEDTQSFRCTLIPLGWRE